MSGIKAFAPASIGNIGVGFDIMGLALEYPGDEVIASKSNQKGVRITKMTGHQGKLPYEPEKNTAGMAVLKLLEFLGEPERGIDLEVHKNLPLGSGMGSSAASAVAAVWATSELLKTGMSKRELLPFACAGEAVASGSIHGDNVAPSLLGGIILIRDNETFDVQRLYVPKGLYVALVHPAIKILTQDARAILTDTVPMKSFVQQTANAAAFVVGLLNSDFNLIGRCLRDVVIEPQRAKLIPGFYDVQAAAMAEGALGCTISGAGPAIFALCANSLTAENATVAMQRVFTDQGIESTVYLSAVNQEGAIIR
jgi:homoserine kinase